MIRAARLSGLTAAVIAAALVLPVAASSSSQETRPHRATCVGVPDDPLSPNVHVTGSCQATHLGRETFEAEHTVVPTGLPVNGVLPIAVVGGHATHVAANGDELRSEYMGAGVVDLQTGRIEFELDGHYVGGSGRFAGASGTTRIVGVVDDGIASFTEEGVVTY